MSESDELALTGAGQRRLMLRTIRSLQAAAQREGLFATGDRGDLTRAIAGMSFRHVPATILMQVVAQLELYDPLTEEAFNKLFLSTLSGGDADDLTVNLDFVRALCESWLDELAVDVRGPVKADLAELATHVDHLATVARFAYGGWTSQLSAIASKLRHRRVPAEATSLITDVSDILGLLDAIDEARGAPDSNDRGYGSSGALLARLPQLDEPRTHVARLGTEPLVSLAQRFLDDPPAGASDHILNRIESNATILVASLRDPEPNPVVVEAATAALVRLLQPSVQAGSVIAAELEALDVPADEAGAIGDAVDDIIDTASGLGAADEAADVECANRVQSGVAAVAARVEAALPAVPAADGVPAPAAGLTDEERRRRLADAKLRGDERYLAELRPQLRADLIRSLLKPVPIAATSLGLGGAAWVAGKAGLADAHAIIQAIRAVIEAAFRA